MRNAQPTLVAGPVGAMAINACDLALTEAAGLLRLADLFVGPDSGPMNLAAAGGTPAFALFGTTPVLRYSRFIHPIEPDGGQTPDGMTRIRPELVLRADRAISDGHQDGCRGDWPRRGVKPLKVLLNCETSR